MKALRLNGPADSIGVDTKLSGNGSDFPMLGIKVTTNLGTGFRANHLDFIILTWGRDRPNGPAGRSQYSKETADVGSPAVSAVPAMLAAGLRWRRNPPVPRSELISHPTLAYCSARRPKRKPDPSRVLIGPDVVDTPAAGRDGPVDLRGSADAAGWRCVVVGDELWPGRLGCNNVAPDHSDDRSRTLRGNRCRGTAADGEQPRPDTPFLVARWDWTTATVHGRVGSFLCGCLMKVAKRGPCCY